ncbi:MAG TPA: glycosyltransferase [Solirubrobacteraceae bacterium]|jgi:glycosyltransferase involved in cell wall biosynthesis|nr:glycosyltransferase [Solirubrobacteraceae bacterium]
MTSKFSAQVDLAGPIELPAWPTSASGAPYDAARLLVRVAGEPVGFANVPLAGEPLSPARALAAIECELGPLEQLAGAPQGRPLNGKPADSPGAPFVTVVVCTRNRAQALRGCLDSLRGLEHHTLEFVVVDNAPEDDSTRATVAAISSQDDRFRYVCEPHAGLSWARNRGVSHAIGEIVAFVDDDVRVDPGWTAGVLRGLERRSDVACVTGLVASASLEHLAEQYFDARVWWSSSCEPRVYDERNGPSDIGLHPYAAGALGTGANFAFRTRLLRELGGFDESLGAGSRCAGGEDLDIFVRCLRAGHAVCYEPAALVWHEHRTDEHDLRRQMYCYGKGLSAYLFKYACSPRTAGDILGRLPDGLRHLRALGARSRVDTDARLAREMWIAEARGLLAGPFAYARARWAQSPERRRAVAP